MENYYRNLPAPKTPQEPNLKPAIKPPPPKKPCCKKNPKKKFDLKCLKSDTCKSLNDVEYFLNNFSDFLRYVKLINLLKGKK